MPGKSYAEVLKTDLLLKCMQSSAKTGWPHSKGALRASFQTGVTLHP